MKVTIILSLYDKMVLLTKFGSHRALPNISNIGSKGPRNSIHVMISFVTSRPYRHSSYQVWLKSDKVYAVEKTSILWERKKERQDPNKLSGDPPNLIIKRYPVT